MIFDQSDFSCLQELLKTFEAGVVEEEGGVFGGEGAFGEGLQDLRRLVGAGSDRSDLPTAGDVHGEGRVESQGEFPELFVADGLHFIGRGAVDGAQVDALGFEVQEVVIERCDLFWLVVDSLDDEDFDDEGSSILFAKSEHALFDRFEIDAGVGAVDAFEAAGGGAVEGEFDRVEECERFAYFRAMDGRSVAQDQSFGSEPQGFDFCDQFMQLGIEGRFAVGGDGEDIDGAVLFESLFESIDDRIRGEDLFVMIDRFCGREFTIDAVEVALFATGAQVDAKGFAETSRCDRAEDDTHRKAPFLKKIIAMICHDANEKEMNLS